MSAHHIPKAAGVGLLVYSIGTATAFLASGSPGGQYSAGAVTHYVAGAHWALAFALWYLGALAALGLVVAAAALRPVPLIGQVLSSLGVAGAALSITGAFISGGVDVAMAEGGRTVQEGVAGPVVYTTTEIGNLLAVCAPALCVGVAALVVALRRPLPTWLKIFTVVGGVCGILAPFFFTYFVFLLWTLVAGVAVVRAAPRLERAGALQESLV